METRPPVILNFDSSIGALNGAFCLNLGDWQEKIRFACSRRDYNALCAQLEQVLPQDCGPVFLGSGDYHHISYFLIKRLGSRNLPKIHVVILDNHPDNMRYPFGIHCGSWVSHAAALPFVAHVDVLGITSGDIAFTHAVENRLLPLKRGKLTYWSVGVNTGWAHFLGLQRAFRNFATVEAMAAAFLAERAGSDQPVYFSLDKDVLAPSIIRTNWDQGVMNEEVLFTLMRALKNRIIASDVVGEVSDYPYKSLFKRFMSRLDGQAKISPAELARRQKGQRAFNRQILPLLS